MRSLSVRIAAPILAGLLSLSCQQAPAHHERVVARCPEQRREWTPDELAAIALAGVEIADGYEVDDVKSWTEGCKIYVSISWKPYMAGGQFTAVISAIDGSVLEIIGGL
jgi:hypothetical protein